MAAKRTEDWDDIAAKIARHVAEIMATPDQRSLLSVKQAADRLGISEKSMRGLVNGQHGKPPRIPSLVIGDGARKVEPVALDEYIASRRAEDAA